MAGCAVVALAVCVGAAVATGATTVPDGLPDPGSLVTIGLPVARVIHNLAAALTIGLLIFGASIVPERQDDGAAGVVRRCLRWATMAGGVWLVATVGTIVLGFADIAGTSPTDPAFVGQFQTFVWDLEPLRVQVVSAGIVLLVVSIAATALGRVGAAWAAALSLAALLPLALAGHSAGAADHETSVNLLAFHLLAASVWVGGFLALVLTRPSAPSAVDTVLRRYSAIALVCFVVVLLSGMASGYLRIGGPAGLGSAYGTLLLVKTAALAGLGVLGWSYRGRVIGRLTRPEAARGARVLFARLALLDVVLMGVAFGAATALARTAPPDSDRPLPNRTIVEALTGFAAPAPPGTWSWVTVWRWDSLWVPVAVVAVGVYLRWVIRLARRGDSWPIGRTVSWVAGWVVFTWATSGAPGVYGRISFSWHMIDHMTVSMTVPILLVLAAPTTLGLRAMASRRDATLGPRELLLGIVQSRAFAMLANPVVAAVVFFGSLVGFYYTGLFELALRSHGGHILMHAHFLLAGYVFVWSLIGIDPGPPKWPASLRLLVLFATISMHAFFGVALSTGTGLLAPGFFGQLAIEWIPDPISDQQSGGSIAWAVGELPTLVLALLVTRDWVRRDSAEARRHDRQADRDGDAELTAYNERLARLAAATRPSDSPKDVP